MDQVNFNILQNDVMVISDSLLRVPGMPEDWNRTNVRVLGLASEENVLNQTKVHNFVSMDYNKIRALLGIPNYDFYFQLTYSNDTIYEIEGVLEERIAYFAKSDTAMEVLSMLNDTDFIWDFYWAGGGVVPSNNATSVFTGDNVDLFKDMIANIDSYSSVIVENPDVGYDDLTNGERQALNDFVEIDGGLYLQIREIEDLLKVFGFSNSDFAADTNKGMVVNLDPITFNINIGEEYEFEQGAATLKISTSPLPMNPILVDPVIPDNCITCRWDHGNGKIYFMPDTNDKNGVTVFFFNIAGIIMKKGVYPTSDSKIVIPIERYVLFLKQPTKMDFLLWV
jgi:hypothetical protein